MSLPVTPATHVELPWKTVLAAKLLMKPMGDLPGMDLHEAAAFLGVLARDLDLALWDNITFGSVA